MLILAAPQPVCVMHWNPRRLIYCLTDDFPLILFIRGVISFVCGEITGLSAWLKLSFAISRKHQVRIIKDVYRVLVITTGINHCVTASFILSNVDLNLMNNVAIMQNCSAKYNNTSSYLYLIFVYLHFQER